MTNELYGHVVASDVFGVGYIVPASDVFKDIQQRLSLNAVGLPQKPPRTFPMKSFPDSGYSTMFNTPRGSKRPSREKHPSAEDWEDSD
jgi:hypothetical protein